MDKDRGAFIVAVSLIVVYVITLGLMMTMTKLPELEWTRRIFLLTGLESVVFAGAGFIFGKEVHRKEAESAKSDAVDANDRADKATQKADDNAEKAATAQAQAANTAALAKALVAQINAAATQSTAGDPNSAGSRSATAASDGDFEVMSLNDGDDPDKVKSAAATLPRASGAVEIPVSLLAALRETANELFPTT